MLDLTSSSGGSSEFRSINFTYLSPSAPPSPLAGAVPCICPIPGVFAFLAIQQFNPPFLSRTSLDPGESQALERNCYMSLFDFLWINALGLPFLRLAVS